MMGLFEPEVPEPPALPEELELHAATPIVIAAISGAIRRNVARPLLGITRVDIQITMQQAAYDVQHERRLKMITIHRRPKRPREDAPVSRPPAVWYRRDPIIASDSARYPPSGPTSAREVWP
jgi:hypothetical protein